MGGIVVVDECLTDPPLDGGSRSIFDLVRTCEELGNAVDVQRTAAEFTSAVEDGRRWDVAILSRPETTLRCLDAARRSCGRVIYFGHDLHHRRLAAEAAYGNLPPGLVRAHLALERQCWQRCDLSLYPSSEEVEAVSAQVGSDLVAWFPYFRVDQVDPPLRRDPAAPLVFLGGAGHLPNVTALSWFVDEVLPLMRDRPPRLQVIGNWPVERRHVGGPQVEWLGPLSSEDLHACLTAAPAMIVPLRTGAGLKSKVIDALASSTPLVTTSIGLQGISADFPVGWVGDKANTWPSLLDGVRRGGDAVLGRSRNGVEYVLATHGADAFASAVSGLLEGNRYCGPDE